MTKVFAIDAGNKQTKLKSSKGQYVLDSQFLNKDVKQSSLLNGKTNLNVHTFKKILSNNEETNNSNTYTWGQDIYEFANNNDVIDTIGLTSRYGKKSFDSLANFALAMLGKDFAETESRYVDVNVVTGIPTDWGKSKEVVDQLKDVFNGKHDVMYDDKHVKLNVVETTVVSQPVGTLFDTLGQDGFKQISNMKIPIVDLGGGTTLIDTIDHMVMSENETSQTNRGAFWLYRNIIQKVIKHFNTSVPPTEHQIGQIIRNGIANGSYLYDNNGKSINLDDIISNEIDNYTDEVINEIGQVSLIENNNPIIFTGGGSNIVNHQLIKNAYPQALFAANGETSNVNGYYILGQQ